MAFKLIIASALLVAFAQAGLLPLSAYQQLSPPYAVAAVDPDHDPNPQYSYSYGVHDALTGDIKSQTETRNGDAVQGSYSLLQPDGTVRIVDYTADDVSGFNAVVRNEPAQAVAAVPATAAASNVVLRARPDVALQYQQPEVNLRYDQPGAYYPQQEPFAVYRYYK